MSEEKNKACVRRIVDEVNNRGMLESVEEIISPDYIGHGGSKEVRGPEGYRQAAEAYRVTFPDLHMTIDDMVAEGDNVAWRFTWVATFSGPLANIAPTGRKVVQSGIALWRFENGKAVDAWGYSDSMNMYRQMGINPSELIPKT
jgi:predicted ester cyclase